MNWHYLVGGQAQGPLDETQFSALIQNGTITAETLVWREGMPDWKPYRELQAGVLAPQKPAILLSTTAAAPAVDSDAVCSDCGAVQPRTQLISISGRTVSSQDQAPSGRISTVTTESNGFSRVLTSCENLSIDVSSSRGMLRLVQLQPMRVTPHTAAASQELRLRRSQTKWVPPRSSGQGREMCPPCPRLRHFWWPTRMRRDRSWSGGTAGCSHNQWVARDGRRFFWNKEWKMNSGPGRGKSFARCLP